MGRAEASGSPVNDWKASISSSTEPSLSDSPSSVVEVRRKASRLDASARLKRSQRKKSTSTSSWPCKIHGCNAQFAREADLKRHQRTTKMHSMPSFSCPQCEAAFTRTDALRRHQKSRHVHDGVVVESVDGSKDDGNTESRGRSPSSPQSQEKSSVQTLPVQVTQGNPSLVGPSSYYRSHTANISPYIPPRLQQLSDSRGSQTTHPTSAARTAPWPVYVPVWHNGPLPQTLPSVSYVSHPMYQPSPHYRPHTGTYSGLIPPQPPDDMIIREPIDLSRNLSQPPSETTSSDSPTISALHSISINNEIETGRLSSEKELTADDVVAVLEAALRQAASQSRNGSGVDCNGNDHETQFSPVDSIGARLDHQMEEELMEFCVLTDYAEGTLTEDGDTLLSSGELLAPESLT